MTGIEVIDQSAEKARVWVNDMCEELGTEDKREAHRALRAFLHAVRDRIPVDEAAQLAAQLPELMRGIYYENWVPSRTPQTYHDADTFLLRIQDEALLSGETEASFAASAAMRVLSNHVSEGEIEDVLAVLPEPVRALLTAEPAPQA
jgi:uncharacterized protein (DUF2267 family)